MSTPPIACTLTSDQLRTRRQGLLPGLAARAEAIEWCADGVRLRFAAAPDLVGAIAAVIEAERECCRFLTFELTVEADGGPIALRVRAPAAAMPLVADLIARP
jgi:hypothetical protein